MGFTAVEKVLARASGSLREHPPVPHALHEIVVTGGNTGWLMRWRETQQPPMNADGRR